MKARAELPARHAKGRAAEDAVAVFLQDQGFRVLYRNLRIGSLEIDLVAKKDDLVIVVEVRARGPGAFEKPLASITHAKKRTLVRAARALYRGRVSKMPDVARMRIDVAAVTFDEGGPNVEWIKGALTVQDAYSRG